MDVYLIAFAVLVLAFACYSDIRKRSVSNIVWLVMTVAGIAAGLYRCVGEGMFFFIMLVLSVIITGTVSYLFFRFGFFGAADAKALVCLALLFARQPAFSLSSQRFPLFGASIPVISPFALAVLLNAAVLASTVPLFLFLRNLFSLGLKGFTRNTAMYFIAYRVNIGRLKSNEFTRIAQVCEDTDGGLAGWTSLRGIPLNDDKMQWLNDYLRDGRSDIEVWVTPELPFIPFITLGFAACCFLGI